MLKIILITVLLLRNYVYSLNSDDICTKTVECSGNICSLSKCRGNLDYECSRLECARSEDLCEKYQEMIRYLNFKRNVKLENLKALGSIRGVPFVTKTLRKYDNIKNNIQECSDLD
jgi:hypothetical protein